jgi:hypothetical protein
VKHAAQTIPARLLGTVILVSIASACASLIGVEEATPLGDAGTRSDSSTSSSSSSGDGRAPDAEGPCVGAGCPCAGDSDCTGSLYGKCVSGVCSECTTDPDSCPVDQYCLPGSPDGGGGGNKVNECATGCKSDDACRALFPTAPYCNPTRHQCVVCKSKADCPNLNQDCSPAGLCAIKCPLGPLQCPSGYDCCSGFCVDPNSDAFHCGGCDQPCTGSASTCCAGRCKDPLTSVEQCGSCTTNCNTLVKNAGAVACVASKCTYAGSCSASFDDCDGDKTNGCECPR